ncbi:MAG: acetamidase/formamidase family protein [Rubrobacteraceae bacterium]|uniref:formamidase n=1 Tax=Rubrobacter naiadicus TaxID=1392641 RepID=UPI00236003AA|nr:formamidase [Rubrobacter naiadicus]MBX6762292.1 acetamidase/formamidase family protein [Rubrobacteraceae bacterium]MCL6436983.1 acetamidase/formamidase family protein [Rubrobacteraceae bacterium]
MPEPLLKVDLTKPAEEQDPPVHNRWHPEIPPVASVNPGDVFRVECKDWTDGFIQDNDDASDVRDMPLSRVHILSGPVAVNGAEPGDLLVVDLLDIGVLPDYQWGYTGIFARDNGGSFLADVFPEARKAIWSFDGIYASSRHIGGVRFPGIVHPGQMGTAPSADLLARWNRREQELISKDPGRVPPLANPPTEENAILGSLSGAERDRVAREAARTVPPRENCGNHDIKNLSRGARAWIPVYVPGANLSVGDIHFSQGDGEITFCGAIETAGWIDFHVDLIKDGMNRYGIANAVVQPSPIEPHFSPSRYLLFEGISVDDEGTQHYVDATVSYRDACLKAIRYLGMFGYDEEQAYAILSTAPIEGRVSAIVDIPSACCTVGLPVDIFDFDIRPSADGPARADRGRLATPR